MRDQVADHLRLAARVLQESGQQDAAGAPSPSGRRGSAVPGWRAAAARRATSRAPASGSGAGPPRSRSARCRRSCRARCSARTRRRRDRAPGAVPIRSGSSASSALNESLARRERAAVEPSDEDLVEAGAPRARAAEHPEDIVANRARIVLGEEDERLQHFGRGAGEVGAGVGLGQVLQRRARAALELRALVEQLGQGARRLTRVLGRGGQRAALQPGLGDVGDANAARNELAARR